MNIFQLLSNNEALNDEEKKYAEYFDKILRDKLIDELVILECNTLIEQATNDKEIFKSKIENIFINGKKGFKDMPTKTLIDIYLERKNEGDFIYLIESLM